MLSLLKHNPLLPVVVVDDPDLAVDLAHALAEGGIRMIEITLRTPSAFEAVRRIHNQVPQVHVGVGTVKHRHQLDTALQVGAQFAISPIFSQDLAQHARYLDMPFMPGVCTPSESFQAHQAGFDCLKWFPAAHMGGASLLQSLISPFPELFFCPTGGIQANELTDYLTLSNVVAVGTSWLSPAAWVKERNWLAISQRVRTSLEALNKKVLI
jgi:2-dehydro-3-deoxyphosphogluconate aldolase/(4S)-4-hydroxy-2-oxoglutarate aldolase